jgi:hypothetical protein
VGKVKIESFSALSVDKRALVSWSGGSGGRGVDTVRIVKSRENKCSKDDLSIPMRRGWEKS